LAGERKRASEQNKRALVLSDGPFIGAAELELESAGASRTRITLREAKDEVERDMISRALQANGGNISKTAKALGISRPTLYELLARHDLI